MSKQTGLIAGSTIFFLASLISFIARFATSVIVARTLGVEGKGLYALVLLVNTLLILFLDPGLSSAITYLVASRQYQPGELFFFALWASILLSVVGGSLFYLCHITFLAENFLAGLQPIYIQLILILLPINLLTSYLSGMLLGLQKIFIFNLIGVFRVGATLIFQILSALQKGGVLGALLAYVVANFFTLLLALWAQRKAIRLSTAGQKLILTSSLSYGFKNYFANLTQFFNYRLDTFIVNFFGGSTNVGLYSTGVATAELLWYMPNAVSGALFPKSASLEKEHSSRLTSQACRQTLIILIPFSLVFALLGSRAIPLIYGTAFQASVIPFLLLLPGIVGLAIGKIIFANLSGSGKPQYATFSAVFALGSTILLDVLLIPAIGIKGAAIASSLSYLLIAFLAIYWFYKETNTRWSELIIPQVADFHFLIQFGRDVIKKSLDVFKQAIHLS